MSNIFFTIFNRFVQSELPLMESQEKESLHMLKTLQNITLNMNEKSKLGDVQIALDLFNVNFPFSFNFVLCHSVYSSFVSRMKDFNIYFEFLQAVEAKEKELFKNDFNIFDIFSHILLIKTTQESNYLLEKLYEKNIINDEILKRKKSFYFAQYKTLDELKNDKYEPFSEQFLDNYEELSKNDWELHKKLIKEGVNPNEIAKIIRNDEIEKLQEISSRDNFDFNQTIEPSLYERCSFINQENVTLIDYAAFFGSVKCFKYLLMNGANVKNTGKYAIAGGNLEIIHLCEQNHSSFEGAYSAAIEFHRIDIMQYVHENEILDVRYIAEFGRQCIYHNNYELFTYFKDEGMEIDDSFMNEAAKNGNIFLVQYFNEEVQIPNNVLVSASKSGNLELVKYLITQKKINVNVKDNWNDTAFIVASEYENCGLVKFLLEQEDINVIARNKDGETALIWASQKGHTEIVKLLLEQEGIDINAINKRGYTALILASWNGHTEIVKLLLE